MSLENEGGWYDRGMGSVSEGGRWSLSLAAGFHLREPSGALVRLPTWKTEALLVMIARASGAEVSKDTIFRKLWPGQDAAQASTNLRQTVRRLRQVLGSDAVTSSRSGCSLAKGFEIDLEDRAGDPHFGVGESAEQIQTPTQALLQMVSWALERSPERAIDLMRSNHDIVLEFTPTEIIPVSERLLSLCRPTDPYYGWAIYLLGNGQFQTAGYPVVAKTFAQAFKLGEQHGDTQLMALSGIFLVAAALAHGRMSVANRLMDTLEGLANQYRGTHIPGLLMSGRATLFFHEGKTHQAIQLAERSIELIAHSAHDQANAEAQWAVYLASAGKLDAARKLLDAPIAYAKSNDFHRLDLVIGAAEQMILVQEGDFTALHEHSVPLIRQAVANGAFQLEVQVREMLAVGAWESGNRGIAEQEWRLAQALRNRLGLAMTQWDRTRLARLPLIHESPGEK